MAKTKTAGITIRSDTWRETVGRKMQRCKSTAKAKEKAKAMENVRMQDIGKGAWEPHGAKAQGTGCGKKGMYWFNQVAKPCNC